MDYRNLQIPSAIINKLGIPQIVNIIDQLPVNPKYTWAQLAGTRDIHDLTTIACHHDAYPKRTFANKTALEHAIDIARDHIKSTMNEPTGDAGFPYHFMIYGGTVYQTNNILDRVYGVASNNAYTVHVMVAGEYAHSDSLTDADRNALYGLLLTLKSPDVLPAFQAIKGHWEFPNNKTDCPGYDINRVRADVEKLEIQLKYAESEENAKATAYKIANQILFLYNLAQGKNPDGTQASEGNMEWAKQMLLELEPFMQERSLL